MTSQEIFAAALSYENKIYKLYKDAAETIDDDRGKAIFLGLAEDEKSHIDFLNYSLEQLKIKGEIDLSRLQIRTPTRKQIEADISKLTSLIPDKMLGDTKKVLTSALKLELETSAFYREWCGKTEGELRSILEKFLEIEERHVDVVQIELDHASNSGIWFNYLEVDMEA